MIRTTYRGMRHYHMRMLKAAKDCLKTAERSSVVLSSAEAESYYEIIERHQNSMVYIRHQYYGES